MMEKSEVCSMCGTSTWQWTEDENAYEAVMVVCKGCERRDWKSEDTDKKPPGASITLVTADRAEQLRNTPSKMPVRRRKH